MQSPENSAAIELAAEGTTGTSPKSEIRRVPDHVRQAAREAASSQGMTLGEFLSEAILAYADFLQDPAIPVEEEPLYSLDDLRNCEHRIAVLEQRVRVLEMSAKQQSFMTRRWLANLVERPWLRTRNY